MKPASIIHITVDKLVEGGKLCFGCDLSKGEADMVDYLKTNAEDVTKYSNALFRRMIKKITVYGDHFVVEFKSEIEIMINE